MSTRSLGLTLLLLLLPSATLSRTWHVFSDRPGDAPTIQAAIDSSGNGDLIQVGPGSFSTSLNTRGKAIHLLGSGSSVSILDGSLRDSSVVMCVSGETNGTIIEGFTITGGKGTETTPGNRVGGGVFCFNSAPVFRSNVIEGNSARSLSPDIHGASSGGGISISGSSTSCAIFENNVISNNFAQVNGGGGWISGPCLFRNNTIERNETQYGDGGGLYVLESRIEIDSNIFRFNIAGDHGGGLLIAGSGVNPTEIEIHGNLILGNQAHEPRGSGCAGGGIILSGGAYVHHNTIAFNLAESPIAPAGGGLCLSDSAPSTLIESNIIYHNQAGGITTYVTPGSSGGATLEGNLIYNNGLVEIGPEAPGFSLSLLDNIFVDPLFCVQSPDSDGELAAVSPALHQSWGVIGAVAVAGCGPYITTTTRATTWGRLKSLMKWQSKERSVR